MHVSEELRLCVRGEVINFDDLWDWATDLGWDLAEMPHQKVQFRTILCLISALAGWDLSRSASHLTRPLILIQSKFQVGAQRLKLLQKRGNDASPRLGRRAISDTAVKTFVGSSYA